MVFVDIGDHCQHRLQIEERGITLVRFGDQHLAFTKMGVTAAGIQAPADDEGRIQTRPRSRDWRSDWS